MSEKDRDEIAGMLTNRQIEDLGAPWLAMGAAAPTPPTPGFYIPPMTPYVPPKNGEEDSKPLSIEGSVKGSAGSLDKIRRISPDVELGLRYRRPF